MFVAPRFIAIDDNATHLSAIQSALQRAGTSSYGIHYRPEDELPNVFSGVRCLFVDLHLVTSLKTSDERQNYGVIAGIIDSQIAKDSGPFLLVVWTAYPQLCKELEHYLNDTLAGAKPVALLPLPKADYIDVDSGEVKDANGLRAKIDELLGTVPQLSALLAWEQDVLVAAGTTLASILTLIPDAKRDFQNYPAALDSVLSKLACAAVGRHNVDRDPRTALVQALVPILADRISNRWSDGDLDVWKQAITKHGDKSEDPTPSEAAEVNRMLHLAPVGPEKFGPADWGSVVSFPFDLSEESVQANFGVDLKGLFGEFKVGDGDRDKVVPVLVRIGAVCDVAQQKKGPIPYLFGFKVPTDLGKKDKPPAAIWKSPAFAEGDAIFCLQIHNRFGMTVQGQSCAQWKALYRMREPLLMQLISANAEYISRPGIIYM
jgi:hypothetical protein